MRRNATHAFGAFHPVIFFALVYGISLFLAIFVCRTVYYSINDAPGRTSKNIEMYTGVSAEGSTASIR